MLNIHKSEKKKKKNILMFKIKYKTTEVYMT